MIKEFIKDKIDKEVSENFEEIIKSNPDLSIIDDDKDDEDDEDLKEEEE